MLDLNALTSAFAHIGALGKGETTIIVDGVSMSLRILHPFEDAEVQRYARGDDDDKTEENVVFIERYKHAVLARAIVQIGSLDLRDVTSIPTGDVLPSGVPIHVDKTKALLGIVSQWSRLATQAVFKQYADFQTRVEAETEARIQYSQDHLDAEVARLRNRLEELTFRQSLQSDEVAPSTVTSQVAEMDDVISTRAAEARQPIPASAPPPPARAQPLDSVMDSRMDPTDDVLAAEMERVQRIRAGVEPVDAISNGIRRTPPHLAAAQAAVEVQKDVVDGVAQYRLPAANLSSRNIPQEPSAPPKTALNPNFRNPRK